jgi:radical SAM protein with 4Fe4S-binding SPASM domain
MNSLHIITHPTKPCWTLVNDLGWQIVELMDGKNSLSKIAQIIKTRYNVNEDVLIKDIRNFMGQIEKSGMLSDKTGICDPSNIAIKSIFLHLTDRCNLNCIHCYAHNMSARCKELTDREIISFIEQFYSIGGERLILSGGEPLMRKDLLKNIIELNRKAEISILSNGTLIDDEFASFIAHFNVKIQVSIDGSTEEVHDDIRGKGAFRDAIAGVEALKKAGLANRVNFCTTIMQQNLSDLPNILGLAESTGISSVRFLPVRRKGQAERNWKDIHSRVTVKDYDNFYTYIYEKAPIEYPGIDISSGISGYVLDPAKFDPAKDNHWCPVGKNLIVDTKGNVFPCVLLMQDKFKLGNIRENRIEDLKDSPILASLSSALSRRKNKISKCAKCMWNNFCQGGCMALALERHGTLWETDDFCDYRKRLYEKAVLKLSETKSPQSFNKDSTQC